MIEGVWWASYVALWVLVALLVGMVVMLLRELGQHYLSRFESSQRDGFPLNRQAPDFSLKDLEGNRLALSSLRQKPVLLVFVSPGCKPCQRLMPELTSFAHSDGGTQILLASGGSREDTEQFYQTHQLPFPIIPAGDDIEEARALDKYGVQRTPFAFYIDELGVVKAKGLLNHGSHIEALVQQGTQRIGGGNGAQQIVA